MVLIQGLSWSQSLATSYGEGYLKPGLKLEDLLPRWISHVVIGNRPQFLPGWWKKASVLPDKGHFTVLLECPHNMTLDFLRAVLQKNQAKATMSYNIALEVTY